MCTQANSNLTQLSHLQRGLYLAQVANFTYLLAGNANAVNGAVVARITEKLRSLSLHRNTHIGDPFSDSATNVTGFVATTQTDIVIALRGSWELADWQNNLQLWQEACVTGGQVHAGFKTAAHHLVRLLAPALRQTMGHRAKQLWLTGHSSGGAIAILLAHQFKRLAIAVAGIYTYGAPKVGDATYARGYPLRDRLHAFKTAGDLIPSMPISHYHLYDWRLRYTDYTHVIEPEELSGTTHTPTPSILHTLWAGKSFAALAALAIERSAHSLIGAYIPLLQVATAPTRPIDPWPARLPSLITSG